MIYIIITSIIISHICNHQIYKICDELKQSKNNTIAIYITVISSMILIYYKYGLTTESIKYLSLIPFIIIISIIDYHTTYIYDITLLSGIIIQGVIFITTINKSQNPSSHISAMIIGLVLAYIIAIITKALGQGDVGLFALCAFTLGDESGIQLIQLSFVLALPYCIYLLILKRDKKIKISFAPFISLATITIMLTNNDIFKMYFDIISN